MAVLNHIDDVEISHTIWTCRRIGYYQTPGAYLRGARKPHYPVPSVVNYDAESYFAVYYCIELIREFMASS